MNSPLHHSMTVALAGNPNCGKTALFNALTGGRQKVGNYPGVTVERKEGKIKIPDGSSITLLDLPGTYSLDAQTPDEEITRDVLLGKVPGEESPSVLIAVADATNLERTLNLLMEIREIGIPLILAVNMMDLAKARGMEIDLKILSRELAIPVVATVAIRRNSPESGIPELIQAIASLRSRAQARSPGKGFVRPEPEEIRKRFEQIDHALSLAVSKPLRPTLWSDRLDRIVVHPVTGTLLLIVILALIFQAVFDWAQAPQNWIQSGIQLLSRGVSGALSQGPLRSLLVDGVIAGTGAVLVFLPQILILFAFILALEDSGYMARAAFLMDRIMGRVGLNGRAFIPLLSSFACAIPGIMATRTIAQRRDRLLTILIAPLTTCSARLPVYSLLISAFIPNTVVFGFVHLQGLVMLGLYAAGIAIPLAVAFVFRHTIFRGPKPELLLELPTYKCPSLKGLALGLTERCVLFLKRAGTVILTASIILWFLSSYPQSHPTPSSPGAMPPIYYSYAGRIGRTIEPLLRPIGFNWQISVALIPGFAAREVMIGALGTVYALETRVDAQADEVQKSQALSQVISKNWSLATGLSLIVWYILACQCLSTLAVTRRETNTWRWPAFMLIYMTLLAYSASFVAYRGIQAWQSWKG